MPRTQWTDSDLAAAVKTSRSIRAVLKKVGLAPSGGNYESIKRRIAALGLDTSHFLGQAILRGESHSYGTRPLGDILVHNKLENTYRLKLRLIREGYKEHRCQNCGNTHWLNGPIPLELHHLDGNRTKNALHNLVLLCPNCHALTDNYRGGNKKKV
jgi:hypothetical protein